MPIHLHLNFKASQSNSKWRILGRDVKRKNFVLFEILIAFSLLTLTVFPFLRYPYQHVKKQIEFFYEMELQRIASAELAKWEIALYQNHEELKDRIFDEKQRRGVFDTDHSIVKVKLSKGMEKTFYRKLKIYQSGRKKTADGKVFSLVNVKLEYFNQKKDPKPIFTAKTQLVAQTPARLKNA